jgi:hypothetical protein
MELGSLLDVFWLDFSDVSLIDYSIRDVVIIYQVSEPLGGVRLYFIVEYSHFQVNVGQIIFQLGSSHFHMPLEQQLSAWVRGGGRWNPLTHQPWCCLYSGEQGR